jgi:hypothetical protein
MALMSRPVGFSVDVESSSGLPTGGVVGVSYSNGPSSNPQQDATHAEHVVWDSYLGRFQGVKESGGCVGPACGSSGDEVASASVLTRMAWTRRACTSPAGPSLSPP